MQLVAKAISMSETSPSPQIDADVVSNLGLDADQVWVTGGETELGADPQILLLTPISGEHRNVCSGAAHISQPEKQTPCSKGVKIKRGN